MKLITNPFLSENLKAFFNSEDYETEPFLQSETVIPVIDVHKFTSKGNSLLFESASQSGTGYKTIAAVPDGKIWEVQLMTIILKTGTGMFSYVTLTKNKANSMLMFMASQTSANEYLSGVLPGKLTLESGDAIGIYQDSGTNAVWNTQLWGIERDAQTNPSGSV